MNTYKRIAQLKKADDFRAYLSELGVEISFDEEMDSSPAAPLAQSWQLQDGFKIGNRFCIHPMEGWDATADGKPTDFTRRRWTRMGQSGAKLIWGGEAVAVCSEGRDNDNQMLINTENLPTIKSLRADVEEAHEALYETSADLLVGLQLVHSGRFSKKPVILYHHPYLDEKKGLAPDYPLMTDAEIETLIEQYIVAVELSAEAGFGFVDIKHCHGYLGHEFLSAYTRPGPYGGSFENRTRFLREVTAGIRARVPQMRIGVRLGIFDMPPFSPDADGVGEPMSRKDDASYWFGADSANPLKQDPHEPLLFLELLEELNIEMVNFSAGVPYANPHILRPALFPPSDGYQPPEDPLVGVARHLTQTAILKEKFPNLLVVGSAYSYLQEWLPNVAQNQVRTGAVDFIGLGRASLSYPQMPADILTGKPLNRKLICRTFSDCTTAPRNGLISGCYPLDDFYKQMDVAQELKVIKREK
ncbi:MAG TPA: NADH:flavin oxidoreductase [Anaerolineales bacterium]|nr:NADH:flavin oxidoreductase [Anaerolineales bacterium]